MARPRGAFPFRKTIQLTRGKVALVDIGDFERISAHKWQAHTDPKRFPHRWYATRSVRRTDGKRVTVLMHREILGLSPTDPEVDHWDGDGLHNWRSNLRLANRAQNVANAPARQDNKTSFKGVYQVGSRYRAQIRVSGKLHHLGYHPDPQAASAAYFEAAKEHFKEFAHA